MLDVEPTAEIDINSSFIKQDGIARFGRYDLLE
jgi:hypothetical protein